MSLKPNTINQCNLEHMYSVLFSTKRYVWSSEYCSAFYTSPTSRKGFFWVQVNSKAPDLSAKPYNLIIYFVMSFYSIIPSYSASGQRRPRSDCASAQSAQGFRCPHMPSMDYLIRYISCVFRAIQRNPGVSLGVMFLINLV